MNVIHKRVNDAAAVRVALGAGVDPNATDGSGNTPLHAAAWPGNLEVVSLLLEHGADPNARNRRGVPVLHEAVRRGQEEMAVLLARSGAAVDDQAGDDGSTPLHWAAKAGRTSLVRFLLAGGADPHLRDSWGRTPLELDFPGEIHHSPGTTDAEMLDATRRMRTALAKVTEILGRAPP
jgi:hypothetical protein